MRGQALATQAVSWERNRSICDRHVWSYPIGRAPLSEPPQPERPMAEVREGKHADLVAQHEPNDEGL